MQFITILAGHQFRPAECKVALAEIKGGAPHTLRLERDPENAWDVNAIKVIASFDGATTEYFIGYVAGADAINLAPYLDNNQEVRDNSGNPLWTEGHTPQVERVEIIDWVSGDKKPTIIIEVSTGYELGTLVKSKHDADEDGDEDFLVGDEGDEDESED